MIIHFTQHAENKIDTLIRHQFSLSRKQVIATVQKADQIEKAKKGPLVVYQKKFSPRYSLEVIAYQEKSILKIITFYPI
jgi:hypothetical protein